MRRTAVWLCLSFAIVAPGCACADAYGTDAATCVEIEDREDAEVDANGDGLPDDGVDLSGSVTGTIVDDGFRASFPGFANCIEDELTHEIALNPGAGARRVRVRWGHAIAELDDKLDIDFDLGATVTLESVSGSWNGALSFILRDDDGIALAVNGENGISAVGDTRIEQGFWRGSSVGGCGISSATGTRIITPDATHDVSNGQSVDVVVDGAPMRFHAFSTFDFGPWWCTDTSTKRNWALVRAPS